MTTPEGESTVVDTETNEDDVEVGIDQVVVDAAASEEKDEEFHHEVETSDETETDDAAEEKPSHESVGDDDNAAEAPQPGDGSSHKYDESDEGSCEDGPNTPSLEEECNTFLKGNEPVDTKAGRVYRESRSSSIEPDTSISDEEMVDDSKQSSFPDSSDSPRSTDEDLEKVAQQPKVTFSKMQRRDSGPGSRNKWNLNQQEFFSEEERASYVLPVVDEKAFMEEQQKQRKSKRSKRMKRRSSLGAVDTGAQDMFEELSDDAADEFLDQNSEATYLHSTEHNLYLEVKRQRERDEAARRYCDALDVEENIPSAAKRSGKSRRSRRHQSVFEQRRSGKPRVPRPRPRSSKDDTNVSGRSLVTVPDLQIDNTARIGTFRLTNAAKMKSPDDMLKKSLFSGKRKTLVFFCLLFGISVLVCTVILFPDLIQLESAFLHGTPFFRGANSNNLEQVLFAKLGPHPDYKGAIAPPEGDVTLVFDRASQITATLHLPNIITNGCHWEILTGNSCVDSDQLGSTPFYNTTLWQVGSPYEQQKKITSIHIGYTASETAGHAIVVYAPGPYYQVACGILQKHNGRAIKQF